MGKIKIVAMPILKTNKLYKNAPSLVLNQASFWSKPLNLIGCHGNRMSIIETCSRQNKLNSSDAIRAIKTAEINCYLLLLFKNFGSYFYL